MGKWAIMIGVCVNLAAGLTCLDRASATTVKPYTMRAMTVNADDIVRGTVVDQEGVYDADRGYVYTHTVIRVTETLSGRAKLGDLVVIRQLGGQAEGRFMPLVGTATYWLGDDVVVFCRTDGAFHYLIGMAQGSYAVTVGADGVERLIRETRNLRMPPLPIPSGQRAPEHLELDALRRHITYHRAPESTP